MSPEEYDDPEELEEKINELRGLIKDHTTGEEA